MTQRCRYFPIKFISDRHFGISADANDSTSAGVDEEEVSIVEADRRRRVAPVENSSLAIRPTSDVTGGNEHDLPPAGVGIPEGIDHK